MELELDNKLGTFYIQTTSWGPFYVQSLFYSFHLSLFWLPGTFECEIHSSFDISFHLIGCERNALLLTKRPNQRLAANFTDFADPRLTRDITGSLQGISLSLSGTVCYKNRANFEAIFFHYLWISRACRVADLKAVTWLDILTPAPMVKGWCNVKVKRQPTSDVIERLNTYQWAEGH